MYKKCEILPILPRKEPEIQICSLVTLSVYCVGSTRTYILFYCSPVACPSRTHGRCQVSFCDEVTGCFDPGPNSSMSWSPGKAFWSMQVYVSCWYVCDEYICMILGKKVDQITCGSSIKIPLRQHRH